MLVVRRISYYLIVIIILGFSCSEKLPNDPETEPVFVQDTLRDIEFGNCNSVISLDSTELDDCFELSYDRDEEILRIKHVNAAFNCCPEYVNVFYVMTDSTILIRERDFKGNCECLCLFTFEYEIMNVKANDYKIEIDEKYVRRSMDEEAIFEIDLSSEEYGIFCFERSIYPWGR